MDQIKDLSAFQGVILSADNYHSFTKITSKGGNEEKVKYIVDKLSNFLKEKKYIRDEGVVEENVENYRKLALYLILNADLPALEDMTEIEGMENVIWMLPTVPPFLLAELLWALHMGRFAAEAVARARPALALQLARALVHHARRLDPVRHLPRARRLAAALLRLLARLHFCARVDPAAPPAVLAAFRACLRHFVDPPDADRVLALSRDDQYRHLGRALVVLLGLVEDCVELFTGRETFRSGGPDDLYLATHAPDAVATDTLEFDTCDSPNEALRSRLAEGLEALLDGCAALVMNVSVDVFCAWSEYEEGGVSLQRVVGERCHRARSVLLAARGLPDHPLPGLLEHLAPAPPAPAARLAGLAPAELARAAAADPAAARAALLAREDLCRHPALLGLLETHLSDFDEDQSHELFDKITDHLNEDQENGERLKVLAARAFRRCALPVKRAIVERLFSEYLHDDLECVEFEETANEIFNRLTAAGAGEPADALAAFVQSPRRALLRAFRAAAEGARQAALMLAVVGGLGGRACASYEGASEPCLVEVANHAFENLLDTDGKRENMVEFVCGLRERGLVSEERLAGAVAVPRLEAALRARDAARAAPALALLARAPAWLARRRAPALAMLAQALLVLRPPRAAFHPAAPPARDRALALIDCILDAYGDERIPEKELEWLQGRLRRLSALDRLHFRRLLPAPPPPPPATHMLQVLCELSPREWRFPLRWAWPARGAALLSEPAAALRRAAPRAPPAALRHALANYLVLLQEQYFESPPTEEQVVAALRAAAAVVERAPAPHARDFEGLLAPLAAALPPAAGPGARAAAARALARAAPALARALDPAALDAAAPPVATARCSKTSP